jgi:hypothetical protein
MSKTNAGSNPQKVNHYKTREEWLMAAIELLRPFFVEHGHDLPEKIRTAIGFTGQGRTGKMRGEAWQPEKSEGGYWELFIRPDTADPFEVLTVLAALLVVVLASNAQNPAEAHKTIAAEIGLRGTRREPGAGPILIRRLNTIAEALGPLPHDAMTIATKAVGAAPKQKARLLLAACPVCGCKIRLTQLAIDNSGLPICGRDRRPFKLAERETDAGPITTLAPVVPPPVTAAPPNPPAADNTQDVTTPGTSRWIARFSERPPLEITGQLRALGGRWNAERKHWAGAGNNTAVQALVVEVGGQFAPVADDDARAA